MRSFTDIFIKHPVLAVVVNLVIVLVGLRVLTLLPVQQYPQIESSSVVITTVYYGASAETIRGFVTTPIERAVSAIGGVDYVESTSRAGLSTVTVRLKLNHDSTRRWPRSPRGCSRSASELPVEAEPPVIEVQRADRPYATFYLSFNSTERSVPAITDYLLRTVQPQLATIEGVQRVTNNEGGRQIAMRVWIDPDRLAALNLSPGDVQAALQRNNYLAAVGQTKGNQVQINLMANTDLRSVDEFANLIVADRDGAIVRLSDVARVELGAEEADLVAKYNRAEGVYLGVWPLVGANEIEVARRLRDEMERIRPTLPKDIEMRLVWDGTMFMRDALKEITKTLSETIAIVGLVVFLFMGSIRTALVPLVAIPISLVGAALVMYAFGFSLNLLTILAIVLSVGLVVDDAIVVVENVERHVRMGKSRIQAALIGARELVGPIIAMTITLAAVYTPIGLQGGLTGSLFLEFAITLAAAVVVSGVVAVTLSPVMSSRFVHPRGKEGRLTAFVNRGFEHAAARLCLAARRCPPDARRDRRGRAAGHGRGVAFVHVFADGARACGGPEPHQPVLRGVARFHAGGDQSRSPEGCGGPDLVSRNRFHVVAHLGMGRLRGARGQRLEGARAFDRGDVRRGVRRDLADCRSACFPTPRPAAADPRPVRRRAGVAKRRTG